MHTETPPPLTPGLARRIGLPLLVCYGLGTILGAGIYVLVGQVAGDAGLLAPLSFLLAALIAGVTALSYCQLVVAFPHSSGAALFVEKGFGRAWVSRAVGYLVILTGVVSAATLVNGFVGYLQTLILLPTNLIVLGLILLMATIALWGIAESLWVAAAITAIEVFGLVWVVGLSVPAFAEVPAQWQQLLIPVSIDHWVGVMSGAILAFYAFIGFEDMVNIVEEVKAPERTMPRGILLALGTATLLYMLVCFAAVLQVPIDQLRESTAPIRDIVVENYPGAARALVFVGLFAVVNGVLIQMIMASRMFYGLANNGHAPSFLALVSMRTRTPWVATLVVAALVLAFALWLPLATLARLTSFVMLLIFFTVNTALWRLQRLGKIPGQQRLPSAPGWGAFLCLALLGFQVFSLLS